MSVILEKKFVGFFKREIREIQMKGVPRGSQSDIIFGQLGENHLKMLYSKTPLIRISGDQFNRFELRGFRIRGN